MSDWLCTLNLKMRALRALMNLGIEKEADLAKITFQGLARQKNVGRTTIREIAILMAEQGHPHLAKDLPRWVMNNASDAHLKALKPFLQASRRPPRS